MSFKAWMAILGVFLGCCSNVVFLELLIRHDPGSGNLITFSQFVFIAIVGFVFTSKFGTQKRFIGFKEYLVLVVMFFITSVCNNYAFNFNIPMPLHMIFRAGSLIANMIMGVLILKRRYQFWKYASVVMITAGVIICTLCSGYETMDSSSKAEKDTNSEEFSHFFWWTIGIAVLLVALLISALMGIFQEMIYKQFGKHPREALFYTHLIPLPGFLIMSTAIIEHFKICAASEVIDVPSPIPSIFDFNVQMPAMVLYLILNVLTQYICISSVYVLTTECTSLTVTLIVTLRKFVSLLFSILYFKNSFTIYHWLGTLLVFTGTIIFTDTMPNIINLIRNRKKQKAL